MQFVPNLDNRIVRSNNIDDISARPIPANTSQRNLKIVTTIASMTAVTFVFYLGLKEFLRIYNRDYHANLVYYYNAMKCMKESDQSDMPGCRYQVYCTKDDPDYLNKFYGAQGGPGAFDCVNDKNNNFFRGDKIYEASKNGVYDDC